VVASTCKDRLLQVPTGKIFWRAQLGCEQDSVTYLEEVPYGQKRMKPRTERATEGRANAKGIPCLYVSTTKETAMSEVRPWVGALVSVAQFRLWRPITIVDCSKLHGQYINLAFLNRTFDEITGKYGPEDVQKIVWAAIDTAFSEPVTDSDDVADYAPTQILAELFSSEGYDGVAYKSAFGESGFNVALFDLDIAVQLNGLLYKVESVNFKFSDNPLSEYVIQESGNILKR
jgi:hypothetical protein